MSVERLEEEEALEDRGEVCFEEKVDRLRRSGMPAEEISQQMGVDPAWVNGLISMWEPGDSEDKDAPTSPRETEAPR